MEPYITNAHISRYLKHFGERIPAIDSDNKNERIDATARILAVELAASKDEVCTREFADWGEWNIAARTYSNGCRFASIGFGMSQSDFEWCVEYEYSAYREYYIYRARLQYLDRRPNSRKLRDIFEKYPLVKCNDLDD